MEEFGENRAVITSVSPEGARGYTVKDLIHEVEGGSDMGMDMLEAANKVNDRVREKKDWLEIKGATTDNNYR